MGAVIEIDPNSPEWAVIQDYATQRLKERMAELTNPALDHDKTQVLRGRVLELEQLLALPSLAKGPVLPADQPGY